MNLKLRAGVPEDAETLGRICYEAFKTISQKHNFPPDFPNSEVASGLMSMMLARPDVYSVVAENGKGPLGSNFLWEGDSVAGVGPITIDPGSQDSGIGKALMLDVIRRADEKGALSVRLVQAAYHSRSLSLYTKLGFDTVEPLANMQGNPLNLESDGYEVRKMTPSDLAPADCLYHRVHRHTRTSEVSKALNQGTATVVEREGRITGYSTGLGFFGHAVGETNDDIKALIAAADSFAGPGFLLPARNAELMRWCLEHGLKVVQPLTLMSRGFYQEPRGAFLPSILF